MQDTLKIFCNIGASWTAHSLSILLGILSGPDDVDRLTLTFDSNFSSPSCFMIIGLIYISWIRRKEKKMIKKKQRLYKQAKKHNKWTNYEAYQKRMQTPSNLYLC
jgi:hypothetical protein